jgi:CBS domain-containing protein
VTKTAAPHIHTEPGSVTHSTSWDVLGDFTTTTRLLPISALAIGIGVVAAFVALALLRLIGLFTNLFYFGGWSTALVSPVGNHLGIYSVILVPNSQRLLPVVGEAGELVGVLTRGDIREGKEEHGAALLRRPLRELVRLATIVASPDESLRVVVYRMAEKGFTRMPVL